ncbi:MAG: hypothetical protein ACK4QL_01770 [Pseudanabaenaceae cyanobacterium]
MHGWVHSGYQRSLQTFDSSDGFILPSRNIACFSFSQSASQFLRCEISSVDSNPCPLSQVLANLTGVQFFY